MGQKIYIHSNDVCERRKLDAQRLATYFLINGHKIVTNPNKADIIILSTCGAFEGLVKYSFNNILRFKKFDAELIITGCIPKTNEEELKQIFNGKTVVTKNLEKIDKYFPENKIKFEEIPDSNFTWITHDDSKISHVFKKNMMNFFLTKKLYSILFDYALKNLFGSEYLLLNSLPDIAKEDFYSIRISWGCSQNCSYCVIKKATGKLQSKPLDQCIKEFKNGLENGFSKFYLTAEDTGAYGRDTENNFLDLLNKLTSIKGDYSIRIIALNPIWLVKYIIDLESILKKGTIKGILIPVQSANNRILKLMHRYHNTEKILDAFIRLKKAYPDLKISTHLIVGFPSETEDEFKETLEFIKKADIDMGFVFPISIISGTEAEKIEPKINKKVVLERMKFSHEYLKSIGYRSFYKGYGPIAFAKK